MDTQVIYFCELIKNVIHPREDYCLDDKVDWTYQVQLAKSTICFRFSQKQQPNTLRILCDLSIWMR